MTDKAPESMTNTLGYYNPNRWPLELMISRYNATLYLGPGDFIRDNSPQRRKINDPYFDVFVKTHQLAKETSDTPVPLITIPVTNAHMTTDGQSVHVVTEFRKNEHGVNQPVIANMPVAPAQSGNRPSYQGMSMDQARRLGFVKKVRQVPEDFGVPDTDSGLPPTASAPTIKFSRDTDQLDTPHAKPALPANILQAAVPKGKDAAARRQIQEQLQKSAEVDVDNPTGFLNATNTIPANVGLSQAPVTQVASANTDGLPEPKLDESLPATPDESNEMEEIPIPKPAVAPVKIPPHKIQFACMECSQTFKFRKELLGHAKEKHADKVDIIMAPYPRS